MMDCSKREASALDRDRSSCNHVSTLNPLARIARLAGARRWLARAGLIVVATLWIASGGQLEAEEPPEASTTALKLAHDLGMEIVDSGSVITLKDPYVTVRLFPGTNLASVHGTSLRLKSSLMRTGDRIQIPARPARYLSDQIYTARARVAQSRERIRPPAIKPLPPPRAPRAVEAPRPVEVQRRPARTPLRARPTAALSCDPRWRPTSRDRSWRWIVIHHSDDTEGNAAKYGRIHREVNGWDSLGYHFVVGNGSMSRDGEVEVGPRWPIQKHGAHARNHSLGHNDYNEKGVGICLVGDFDEAGRTPSRRQMDELTRLVRWLMARYDISADMVVRHEDLCSTQCPGRYFPWSQFKSRLRSRPAVPSEPVARR